MLHAGTMAMKQAPRSYPMATGSIPPCPTPMRMGTISPTPSLKNELV